MEPVRDVCLRGRLLPHARGFPQRLVAAVSRHPELHDTQRQVGVYRNFYLLICVMNYEEIAIKDEEVPNASSRIFQHLVKTYASEVNKLNSVWHEFAEGDLAFKPHPRASTVGQIMEHELLSERRFFGEFLGLPEVPANEVLPPSHTPQTFAARMVELARERLQFLAK